MLKKNFFQYLFQSFVDSVTKSVLFFPMGSKTTFSDQHANMGGTKWICVIRFFVLFPIGGRFVNHFGEFFSNWVDFPHILRKLPYYSNIGIDHVIFHWKMIKYSNVLLVYSRQG